MQKVSFKSKVHWQVRLILHELMKCTREGNQALHGSSPGQRVQSSQQPEAASACWLGWERGQMAALNKGNPGFDTVLPFQPGKE